MPYKKRMNKTKFKKKRRGVFNKGSLGYNIAWYAKRALRTASYVAKQLNAESKYDDTTSTNTNIDYSGTIVTLCNPAQGTTALQREGDSIKIQNLTLRSSIYLQGGLTSALVRIIIFWDKENSISAATDLLQVAGSALSVYSPKFEDTKFNTNIIHDKVYTLDTTNVAQRKFEWVYKINKHVNFAAGTTTIKSGALKILFVSNTTGTVPGVQYYSRVTYLDN